MQCLAGSLEFFPRGGVVNFDRRKGVEMNAEDFIATDEFGGFHRIVHAHREIVANAQHGEFQIRGFADEFHVHRQRGVAGEIKIAFHRFDGEAAGIAAERAVGQRAGVNGVHKFGAAKIELKSAAVIERMDFRRAVFVQPRGNLVIGDHQRAGASGDFHRVADVIRMPVRDEDEIRRHRFHVNGFRERIAGDERVKQQRFAADHDGEAGMTVVSDFHWNYDSRYTIYAFPPNFQAADKS